MTTQTKIPDVQLITRNRTATLLGYDCTASVRRLEQAGKLTPIKINSRRTMYRLAEVQQLATGGATRHA